MPEEYTTNLSSFDMSIDAVIGTNKTTILQALNNTNGTSDTSMLQGTLNFCHSKLTSYILDTLCHQYQVCNRIDNESDAQQLLILEKIASNIRSVGTVIDKIWIDIHHPAIKSYQSLFFQLSKLKDVSSSNNKRQNSNGKSRYHNSNNNNNSSGSQTFVEYRKLFDKFVKLISKALDFYFSILQAILNKYDLSIYIPVRKICSTLKINLDTVTAEKDSRLTLPKSNYLASSIVYLTHKCVLYIGDLSRYRTLMAKTYLPSTTISKEDNNNYSKSIELYKLSLLILPSLGDPYNHIAIIDNVKDDKFNVVYNFVRASLTSTPLDLAQSNLLNLLNKNPKTNTILKKFEHLNCLDRKTITKNDRHSLLKSQFLILFNYNLLPTKWNLKSGYLVTGHATETIENDFYYLLSTLDFHKQIFNDFYFKQVVILLGGFELLIDPKNMENSRLKQSTEIISNYLAFLFRFLKNLLKICINICNSPDSNDQSANGDQESGQKFSMAFSTSLLPVVRLLLCWFKEREIARVYMAQSENFADLLAILINRLVAYLNDPTTINTLKHILPLNEKYDISTVLNKRPVRTRLFKEDVALREFKPINYVLDDFDDSHFYIKDANAVLALIGDLPSETDKANNMATTSLNIKFNDNILRLVAIIVLGKKLVLENTKDIKWVNPTDDTENNKSHANQRLIGLFAISKKIDLSIKPIFVKHETENSNFKYKDQRSKKNSVNDISSNGSVTSLATSVSYAGSSFSNFGSIPPEAFAKVERPRRNKSNNNVNLQRPNTSLSAIASTRNEEIQTPNRRPLTSPNEVGQSFDDHHHNHSKYVDMVANIVNDDKRYKTLKIKNAVDANIADKCTTNKSPETSRSTDSSINNYDHIFKWDSTKNGASVINTLNPRNAGSTTDNDNHNGDNDNHLLNQYGFNNVNSFNSVDEQSNMVSLFETNNINNINNINGIHNINLNMSMNRVIPNMNDFNSYNMDFNNILVNSNGYMNNMNNLNMRLNNYPQPPLQSVNIMNMNNVNNMNMGSMNNMNISNGHNMNMNVGSSTNEMSLSLNMQNSMNYMNGYRGYNSTFPNSNPTLNGYNSPASNQQSVYGNNPGNQKNDPS